LTDLPLKHHIASTLYEIIPLSMLSNHPCTNQSGCEFAFLVFSLQNPKRNLYEKSHITKSQAESIWEITQNLHGTL